MKTSENKSGLRKKCLIILSKFIIISVFFILLFQVVIHIYLVKNQDMYPAVCPGDLGIFLTFHPDYSANDVILCKRGEEIFAGRIKEKKESGFIVYSDSFPGKEFEIKEDALIGKLIFLLRRRNF